MAESSQSRLWLETPCEESSSSSTVDVDALKSSSARPRLVTINEDWDALVNHEDDTKSNDEEDTSSCSHTDDEDEDDEEEEEEDDESTSNSSGDSDSSEVSATSTTSDRKSPCNRHRDVKPSMMLSDFTQQRRRSRHVVYQPTSSHAMHRKASLFNVNNSCQMGPPLKAITTKKLTLPSKYNKVYVQDKAKFNSPATPVTKLQNKHIKTSFANPSTHLQHVLSNGLFTHSSSPSALVSSVAVNDTKSSPSSTECGVEYGHNNALQSNNIGLYNVQQHNQHTVVSQESLPSFFESTNSHGPNHPASSSRTTASLSSLDSLLPDEEVLLAALDLDLDEAPSSAFSSPSDQLITPLEAQPLQLNVSSEEDDSSAHAKMNHRSNKCSLQSSRRRRYNASKASKSSYHNSQAKMAMDNELLSQGSSQTSQLYFSSEITASNPANGLMESALSPSSITRALQPNDGADVYLNQNASNVSPDSGIQSEGFSSSPLHVHNDNSGINSSLTMLGFNNASSVMVFNPIAMSEANNVFSQIIDTNTTTTAQLFAPAIHFRPSSRVHQTTTTATTTVNHFHTNPFRATPSNSGLLTFQDTGSNVNQPPLLLPNVVPSIISSSLQPNDCLQAKKRGRGRPKGSKNKTKNKTKTTECASQTDVPRLLMRQTAVENVRSLVGHSESERISALSNDMSSPPVPVFMATCDTYLPKRPGRPRKHPPTLEPQVEMALERIEKGIKRHHKNKKRKKLQQKEVEVITLDDSDHEAPPTLSLEVRQRACLNDPLPTPSIEKESEIQITERRRRKNSSSSSSSSSSSVTTSATTQFNEGITTVTSAATTMTQSSPSLPATSIETVKPLFDKRFNTVKPDLLFGTSISQKPSLDFVSPTTASSLAASSPPLSSSSTSAPSSSRLVTKASFKLFSGQSNNSSVNVPSMKTMLNALAEVNRKLKPGRKSKKHISRRQSSESGTLLDSSRPLDHSNLKCEAPKKSLSRTKVSLNDEQRREKLRRRQEKSNSTTITKVTKSNQLKKWRTKHTNVVDPVFDSQLLNVQQALKLLTINFNMVAPRNSKKISAISLPSIFERRATVIKNGNHSGFKKGVNRHKTETNVGNRESNIRRRASTNVAEQRLPLKKRHHHLDDAKKSREDTKNGTEPTNDVFPPDCKESGFGLGKTFPPRASSKGSKRTLNKRVGDKRSSSLSSPAVDQPPTLQCEALDIGTTLSPSLSSVQRKDELMATSASMPPTLSPPHVSETTSPPLPPSCYSVQSLESVGGVKLRLQRSASRCQEHSMKPLEAEEESPSFPEEEPKKRGRGRPKGSTNKKKLMTSFNTSSVRQVRERSSKNGTKKKVQDDDKEKKSSATSATATIIPVTFEMATPTTTEGDEPNTTFLGSVVKPKIRKQPLSEDQSRLVTSDEVNGRDLNSSFATELRAKKCRKKRRSNRTGFPSVRPRKRPKAMPRVEQYAFSSPSTPEPQGKRKRGRPPKHTSRTNIDAVEYEGAFKRSRLYVDEDNTEDCLETLPSNEQHDEETQNHGEGHQQECQRQKQRSSSLVAGLFSLYYKRPVDKNNAGPKEGKEGKTAERLEYRVDEHVHGLLPPPYYCGRQLRQRHQDFDLPFDLWCSRNQIGSHYCKNRQRSNFKRIPCNIYVDVRPVSAFETQPCQCNDRRQERSESLCTADKCINRMTYTECDSGMCSEHCTNNSIQRRRHLASSLEIFMTGSKGYGVRAKQQLPSGVFVLEYVGEVVSDTEFKRRMVEEYYGDTHHYCLHVHKGIFIDGHRKGNMCRFVNHSCEPNCEIQKWTVQGLYRMVLFTLRPIEPGEELTYDYNFELFNPHEGQQCLCGSAKCRGVIADKSQRVEKGAHEEEDGKKETTCASTKLKSLTNVVSSSKNIESTRGHGYNNNGLVPFLAPVKALSTRELVEIRVSRCFLIRNLEKIRKYRETLNGRLNEAKQNSNNNVSEDMIKTGLTALTTARSMQTRRLASARDDPNVAKVVKLAHMLREMFARVVTINDPKGLPVARFFNVLPSKKKACDYFELLRDPIDLQSIDRNINKGNYSSPVDFVNDLLRLLQNNIRFYGHFSAEGQAALKMRSVFHAIKSDFYEPLLDIVGRNEAACFTAVTKTPVVSTSSSSSSADVIRCPCGQFEDAGFMIQCDKCQVWQHGHCVNWSEESKNGEEESFFCESCGGLETDKNIVMETQPEYAAEDEQYYVSMMRDDLQIRLGDTVYVLRAPGGKGKNEEEKRDQRESSKKRNKLLAKESSSGKSQRRRGRKLSTKEPALRTAEEAKTSTSGEIQGNGKDETLNTVLSVSTERSTLLKGPDDTECNGAAGAMTTPAIASATIKTSETKLTGLLSENGEDETTPAPLLNTKVNDDAENNNDFEAKKGSDVSEGVCDKYKNLVLLNDRSESEMLAEDEEQKKADNSSYDLNKEDDVKGIKETNCTNDVEEGKKEKIERANLKDDDDNKGSSSAMEYNHGGIPHKMMSPTKGPSLEAWSLSKLDYPSYKTFSSSSSLSTLDMDIFRIERLWVNGRGERFAFGHHYLRPHETFHEPTRRFFANEVFRAPIYEVLPLDSIWRQCWVLDVASFCRGRPLGCVERDVYICEFRVDKSARFFKKIANKGNRTTPTQARRHSNDASFDPFDLRIKPVRNHIPSYVPEKFRTAAPGRGSKGGDVKRKSAPLPSSTSTRASEKRNSGVSSLVASGRRRQRSRQVLETTLLRLLDRFPKEERMDASYLLETEMNNKRLRKKTSFGSQYVSII